MAPVRLTPTTGTLLRHLQRTQFSIPRQKLTLPTHLHHYPLRTFTTTQTRPLNPLLNLSHFSAAKEAQHLSREKRIPREEFHPYLQLIRSSSVDPFAPAPGSSPSVVAALARARQGNSDTESALRLAVSNLMGRLEATKAENEEVIRALVAVQERWRREERNALVIVGVVAVLGCLVVIKTRVVEDLMAWVGNWGQEDDAFRWGLLGSSSEHLQHLAPRRMSIVRGGMMEEMQVSMLNEKKKEVVVRPEAVTDTVLRRGDEIAGTMKTNFPNREQSLSQSQAQPSSSSQPTPHSRSLFSRLFWAAPSST